MTLKQKLLESVMTSYYDGNTWFDFEGVSRLVEGIDEAKLESISHIETIISVAASIEAAAIATNSPILRDWYKALAEKLKLACEKLKQQE